MRKIRNLSSSNLYVAYASDVNGTGFSLTASDSLPYRAEFSTTEDIENPTLQDFIDAGAVFVNYIGLSTSEKLIDTLGYKPVNENAGTIWHTKKWFTPSGTFTSSGTSVTTVGGQLTSQMIGARIGLVDDSRIITAVLSANTCTVDSVFNQDYANISSSDWGVYNRLLHYTSNGFIRFMGFYTQNGFIIQGDTIIWSFSLTSNGGSFVLRDDRIIVNNNNPISFSEDVGLRRNTSGLLEISNTQTAGVFRDLVLRNLTHYGIITNASDERLKENIRPVNNGLDKSIALADCIKHFEFKNQDQYANGLRTDFIAQLLKDNGFEGHVIERMPANEEEGLLFGWTYCDKVITEATEEQDAVVERVIDEAAPKGEMLLNVESSKLFVYLFPAIKELVEKNNQLEQRISAIEKALNITT